MRKILFFTDYFFPGTRAGGPVTSLSNLFGALKSNFDITIATRNKDILSEEPYENVLHDQLTLFGPYPIIYLTRTNADAILNAIDIVQPDALYLNSFFSVFTRIVLMLRFSGRIKCRIVLAPRGEFQVNALAMKRYRKLAHIAFMRLCGVSKRVTFHATDQIEAERIKLFFSNANIVTLPNLPRVIHAEPRQKDKSQLKLVFVGRIRNNKNLLYAIKILSKCTVDVILDIYGPVEDKKYWRECEALIAKLDPQIEVRYKGLLSHEIVPATLTQYHALFLPTETENFGHAIVEAMQTGVVPIISDQTPWRNLAGFDAGWDIDLDRPDLFLDAIHQLHAMDAAAYANLSASTMRYIQARLKIDELTQEYDRVFNQS